jgi:superfamily II DNA helicase RecQ
MLAVMGPRAAEQVIVVLRTGSGKSLIIMVAAAMEGAGTTVLVLPTIVLRTNMLQRAQKIGVCIITWSPGQMRMALLVVVSAEAACSQGFSDYMSKL